MYQRKEVSFEDVPQLSLRDKSYQKGEESLRPFYKYEVNMEGLAQAAKDRSGFDIDRDLLVNQLQLQYAKLENSDLTLKNIEALKSPETFTIVTAHQPSLLTGPLYFIYKICSVISLSEAFNASNQEFNAVPVFILGGEDHDFEEIATAHLFGTDFTWKTAQVGPTGRMTLDGLGAVIDEIKERLGDQENALELKSIIDTALDSAKSYGDFMLSFVNSLFKEYGLIIVNMDNPAYKERLLPYIIRDLENKDSINLVQADQLQVEAAGYKSQAHTREVNIFWMKGDRHRVIDEGNNCFSIADKKYDLDQIKHLVSSDPGSISPNVILRPVFQEIILPNLAYIGGGGELAYWMERMSLFNQWKIPFPMLIRRDSFKIIDKRSAGWLDTVGMDIMDLFMREEQLIARYALRQSTVTIDVSDDKKALHKVFENLKELAARVDPTLQKTVLSEEAKAQKAIDNLENKLIKAEKNKHEVGINKLIRMKSRFFPGNDGLQERYDNFIPYYLRYGKSWIDEIIKHADPMNRNFKILIEE